MDLIRSFTVNVLRKHLIGRQEMYPPACLSEVDSFVTSVGCMSIWVTLYGLALVLKFRIILILVATS